MSALIKKEHEKAVKLLEENRPKLDALAKYLYEKETITGEEFMHILETGKVPETPKAPEAPAMDLNLEK